MEETSAGIAIVGIGCRFPGADNIDEFWRVLSRGENHVNEIPLERWNLEAFYDKDADAPGKMYVRKAGLLDKFDEFDNKLFGISDKEAERMDPQQRYVLECVFMALQDGGITRESIQGSDTGVFIGVMNDDYSRLSSNGDFNNYSLTGGSTSIISARVSYTFDLRGPCMVIDTACSSSLLAIHLGSQALMSGDCKMVVCGGVNSLLTPRTFIQLSKARMVSPTGQCQAFSANADGYARGEGCGIVLLKRLSDAITDGDKIWATIVTGTNQDGRAVTPMSAPSGEQQEKLLKTVYKKAGVDASDIDYIEAHGTGTKAGDPVEVQSLGKFFLDTQVKKKRFIGSVKTNIGHLESAAGVAGVIKVLLMMKNEKIVKSLLMGEKNPDIDFQKFSFEVPTELTDWDTSRKLACINSFGFGGSNCHVVLASNTEMTNDTMENNKSNAPLLFCFSGQDGEGLKKSIKDFIIFAQTETSKILKTISYSSTARRDHFQFRKAVTANSINDLVGKLKLDQFLETSNRRKRVIFVFGGMATAWKGMCKELISEFKVFKEKIQEIDSCLRCYVSWSLYDRLLDDYNVDDTIFGPIAIFSCQVALVALWKHLGVKPDCILGQSIGEVAASHVAGVWSLSEAVKIIFHRTSVLASSTGGKMLIIHNCQVTKVEQLLSEYNGRANIGLYYSPMTCAVSGDASAVEEIEKYLLTVSTEDHNGLRFHYLKVCTAFHSHHIEEEKDHLQDLLLGMLGSSPTTEIISTVSGEKAQDTDFSTMEYWGKSIREPVQFGKAVVNAIEKDKSNVFVEIGPKPVLSAHIKDLFVDVHNIVTIPSIKPNYELNCVIESAGKMYERGLSLDWNALYEERQPNTESPKYSFCRNKCLYISEDIRQELMGIISNNNHHPFFKTVHSNGSSCEHKIILSPVSFASVFEHRFSGNILMPGALYAEVALALAHYCFHEDGNDVNSSISLKFKHPVLLQKDKTEQLDIVITKTDMSKSFTFQVHKQNTVYAEGNVDREHSFENVTIDIQDVKMRCRQTVSKRELYTHLREIGMTFGEALQLVGESVKSETEIMSELSLNSTIKNEMKNTSIHPAVLDGMLQTTAVFYHQEVGSQKSLPVRIEDLRIRRPVEDKMFVYTMVLKQTDSFNLFHIYLLSVEGNVIAEIERFVTKTLGSPNEEMMFETHWHPTGILPTDNNHIAPSHKWLIITNEKIDATYDSLHSQYLVMDTVGVMLETKSVDLETLSSILFLCPEENIDNLSSETVLQIITRQAMNLRRLLLHLHTHNANVPLFIITENAVHLENKSAPINLVAGSLWGFVKSVLREHVYNLATIVDLQTDDNHTFDILMSAAVWYLLKWENHKELNEFVIHEDTVWCQRVFPNDEIRLYRNNKLDALCKASLLSRNENTVCQPYLQYDNEKMNCTLPNFVEIMATEVVIHDSCLHPQCVPIYCSTNPASNVIALETVGKVSKWNGAHKQVAVFFPCKAGTFMRVPEQCVIGINKISCYQPGFLTKLVLLWHHCMLIDKELDIYILCSECTRPVAKALLFMLQTEQRNTSIQIMDISHLDVAQIYSRAAIVPTVQLNKHITEAICKLWPSAKTLVCMDQILPRHAAIELCNNNLTLQIKMVRASDIFTPGTAIHIIPELVTWILNQKDAVCKVSQAFQDLQAEQTETNVAKLMQCSTIQMCGYNGENIPAVRALENALLRTDCVYIVVGGLTGLGWECVHFLAKRGAGAIVTISRRKAQDRKLHEIGQIEAEHGCEIKTVQTDVTDMTSMKLAFKTIEDTFPGKPIKGIYCGAGVLEDKTMLYMSEDVFVKAAAPKIQGAWNMHMVTKNMPLDFFIMHSSVTAVLGNPGQSNYGAGNAFQDSLAQKRRQAGLVGQSINWGPLNLGMLLDNPTRVKAVEARGYIPLSTDDIHKCLLSALMLNKPTIMAIRFNTTKLADSIMNDKNMALEFKVSPILDIPSLEKVPEDMLNGKQNTDVEELKRVDTKTRLKVITDYITKLVADVLSLNQDIIELDKGLVHLGLDSMQAMTVNNQIYETFQIRITPNGLLHQNLSASDVIELINSKLSTQMTENELYTQEVSLSFPEQTLSYMEYTFYKIYCKNPADPSLYYVNEIALPDTIAQPDDWKRTASILMSRHEVLRTTFENVPVSENVRWNIRRRINPEMKPDFRILKEEDVDEIDKHTTEAFHLETQGPLRFIFICGKTSYFRTIYNSIGFDMQGIAAIFKDIQTIFASIHQNTLLKDLHTTGGSLIVVEMEKMLQKKGNDLKEFWKHWLEVDIPEIRLGKTEQSTHLESGTYKLKKRTLDSAVYDSLLELSKSKGLSMFRLLTSIYQLLLHLMNNETTVAISTTIDVKQYIPNVEHAVGLGTNYIPLLAKFPSHDISVEEFLKDNKIALQRSIDHCVCPLDTIIELAGTEKITNVLRNKIVLVEDEFVISVLKKAENMGHTVGVTKSEDLGTHTETQFSLWNRTKAKEMTLKLTYNSNVVSNTRAKNIIRAFQEILAIVVSDLSVKITDLRDLESVRKLKR
ncbi:fusarin C synthetase-like [Gigantopelta aegis]|uniref:fusarin C synthetase-like n=1 Tax=Gigantopelta aegis TaxID=1735272 RepID=UPI001B88A4D2|nr:fusarin C synthetase-like [Gigantopelta aegis]XP_041353514.1 fusarin C synthetase-like [Gigantopelta aegis]